MYPHPVAPPRNGLGTAGFVVGLIGMLFAFVPIVGVIAWPMVIVGLILSIVGVVLAGKRQATNRGMAIAGVVVSAIGLVVCVIWAVAFANAVNEAANDGIALAVPSEPPAAGRRTVVFTISSGKAVNVRYGDLGDQRSAVVEPTPGWTQTVTVGGGGHHLSLSADAVGSDDFTSPVTCSIAVDGEKVAEQSSPIAVLCSATVERV
ncbi:hypothetical protein [Alloactinosynnema sp. L-07]|uniref:DUF4190 domain-containing protein n=1 Tax=Alloactinosynnema sp. L-07 TaxID=1653480 RepID=UPI00065EF835|nr:DUF4190 domain-containing protein [Alloactinosynnema sp. L-07]CRK61213.1 hypothetical protein [Alloactinosynnema sp. L-07]